MGLSEKLGAILHMIKLKNGQNVLTVRHQRRRYTQTHEIDSEWSTHGWITARYEDMKESGINDAE